MTCFAKLSSYSAIILIVALIQSSLGVQEVDAAIMQQSASASRIVGAGAGGGGGGVPCRMYRYIDDRFECIDQLIYELSNTPMNDLDGDGDGFYGLYSGNPNRIKKYTPNKQRLKLTPRFGRK